MVTRHTDNNDPTNPTNPTNPSNPSNPTNPSNHTLPLAPLLIYGRYLPCSRLQENDATNWEAMQIWRPTHVIQLHTSFQVQFFIWIKKPSWEWYYLSMCFHLDFISAFKHCITTDTETILKELLLLVIFIYNWKYLSLMAFIAIH